MADVALSHNPVVIVAALIENQQGYFLMTQSPKWSGKWIVPGGHVDFGETISEAAVREAREETGLTVEMVKIFAWEEVFPRDFERPVHFVSFRVHCRVIGDDTVHLVGEELSSYQWVTPTEALNLNLADGMKSAIESFINYRNQSYTT